MPRPQHGPPCGLFINNACECIYIHKQEYRGEVGGVATATRSAIYTWQTKRFHILDNCKAKMVDNEHKQQQKKMRNQRADGNKTKQNVAHWEKARVCVEERRETGNWLRNISMVQRSMQWNFWHLTRLFPFSGIAELKELRIIPDIYGVTIVTEKSYFGSLWKSLITVYNSSKFLQKWNRKIIK